MPIYEFYCEECEGRFDQFQSIRREKHEASCPACGSMARRLYSPTPIVVDFRPGYDLGLGEYIDTKRQREEVMRKVGARRIRD